MDTQKTNHSLLVKRETDSNLRHLINGIHSVYHCNHYISLFTQLADDAKLLQGSTLLANAAAESFYEVFFSYFQENQIPTFQDKINIIEQYFSFSGLGQLKLLLTENEPDAGKATMTCSHIDTAWLKKWSSRPEPVNFIGHGFIKAACALLFETKLAAFVVDETESIVAGASKSVFQITLTNCEEE